MNLSIVLAAESDVFNLRLESDPPLCAFLRMGLRALIINHRVVRVLPAGALINARQRIGGTNPEHTVGVAVSKHLKTCIPLGLDRGVFHLVDVHLAGNLFKSLYILHAHLTDEVLVSLVWRVVLLGQDTSDFIRGRRFQWR